jgi:hypothetical protein
VNLQRSEETRLHVSSQAFSLIPSASGSTIPAKLAKLGRASKLRINLGRPAMAKDGRLKPPVDNEISEETGQFDLRFILWRHFCTQNKIPVETLPSQLNDEQREKWDQLKEKRLRKRS